MSDRAAILERMFEGLSDWDLIEVMGEATRMSPRRSRSGLAVGRERRHPGRGNRPNAGPVGVRRRLSMEPPHTLKCVQSGARRYGIRSLRIGDQCLPTAGGWDSERHGRERLVYGLVCPTRYGSRSLWEAKRMSSGPAHPGILVGVDGFAVIKGCCAVSRARGNGAQCSAHPRARRMHARGQLIGSVLANGPNT